MSDEPVVRLVGVPEEHATRQLAADFAMRADGRRPDRSAQHLGIRAHPEWCLESRARAHLDPALQHHRPLADIEDYAGFHRRIVHDDPRRVTQHRAPRRDRVTVAQPLGELLGELSLERPDKLIRPVQHHAGHLHTGGARLRSLPGRPRADAPAYGYTLAGETERGRRQRWREAARDERRRPEQRRAGHRVPHAHDRRTGLDEPCEMGEGENRGRLRCRERFPLLADQMRADPQLRDGPAAGEGCPRGGGVWIEQVEGVGHSGCTSSLRRSACPLVRTRLCPFARTTTMSSTPITARCSLSDQITDRRTSSPTITLPTTTLPRTSGRRMRSNESHEPMSSQRNVPATTASRFVRSSTATSTATGCTALKKPAISPADSLGHPALSSRAYAPASPRKRATPHANRPVFQSAPRRRSSAARAALGFSTKRRTARALPSGLPGTM